MDRVPIKRLTSLFKPLSKTHQLLSLLLTSAYGASLMLKDLAKLTQNIFTINV